eukprot:m.60625 g.60625  ORF g.60625 m.60625 type:complete len:98 (-) comp11339_c0_seq1:138-431(-)
MEQEELEIALLIAGESMAVPSPFAPKSRTLQDDACVCVTKIKNNTIVTILLVVAELLNVSDYDAKRQSEAINHSTYYLESELHRQNFNNLAIDSSDP